MCRNVSLKLLTRVGGGIQKHAAPFRYLFVKHENKSKPIHFFLLPLASAAL